MTRPPLSIVTGATGGIGGRIAHHLAQRGFQLLVMGRNHEALQALKQQLAPAQVHCLALELDRTDRIAPVLQPILDKLGPPRVLVNNAGCGTYQPFLEQTADQHDRLFAVNYLAAAELTRLVLPGMLERRQGHIINIASVSAKIAPWGHAGYAAAKAALVSLTQTLAAEHGRSGVHFSYVNPGIVTTNYFHQPQMGQLWSNVRRYAIPPDRVARRVVALLDRPRLELCVPWHHRAIDWLAAFSPSLAHRLVARQSRPPTAGAERPDRDQAMPQPQADIDPPAQPKPAQTP